ncbi:aldo/keto reductase [Nonomuraea rubra]|uniref:aldo/keto reductase n=1 Tax=Nonomuraea rubra TaxID=46180 RepID=UPI00361D627A
MDTVRLGRTELQVSPICYGTWQFGGDWGQVDEQAAVAAIRHARERGVTFFDTAQGYGFGVAERVLGRALEGDRDQVVIATKGGLRMDGDRLVRDSSPAWLRQGCGRAWKRSAPTTSTCTRCTGPIRAPRSRRAPPRCATWWTKG